MAIWTEQQAFLFGNHASWQSRHRWEDNIKMDLKEVGWGGMDWIDLALDRGRWRVLLNVVMNLQVL
jgi:hypothetical protein